MKNENIFLAFYMVAMLISLFSGFITYEISTVNESHAMAEWIFIVFATRLVFPYIWSHKSYIKPLDLNNIAWASAIFMLVLPFVIAPEHFRGDYYRLIISLVLLWLFIPFTASLITFNPEFSRNFLLINILLMSIYAFVFLITFSSGLYIPPIVGKTTYTFPGFYNIRYMPYLAAPIAVLGILLAVDIKSKTPRWFFYSFMVGLPFLWSILLWSGSRAGVLSALIGLIVVIAMSPRIRSRALLICTYVLPFAVLLTFLYPDAAPSLGFSRILFGTDITEDMNSVSSGRIGLWLLALENIQAHPILGHGIGGFSAFVSAQSLGNAIQVHNGYLEYLFSGGIIAAVSIFAMIGIFYAKLFAQIRKTNDIILIAVFAGITVMLVYAGLDGVLFHYRPLMLTVILFAIANHHLRLSNTNG